MIHFKKVKWKNFLSTGNQFTEIDLDKNNTTLIIGENGAGKSTILDALCFGLFGKPFRAINKAQLINSINNADTCVEVEFITGSKHYKVIRSIKPNKFEIWQNDKMLNQEANSRDFQKILEQQILKLNYRSFTQVVILGSSTFIPFMQLKARFRREVVEEILDIQIFSLMNMILKNRLKDLQDEIREVDYQYEMCAEKITLQENYIDDVKKDKKKILTEKKAELKENIGIVAVKNKNIESLEESNRKLFLSVDDQVKVQKKEGKLKELKATLNEKHKHHNEIIDFFESNEECPTCEQIIDETFKDTKIRDRQDKVNELFDGMQQLQNELDLTEKRLNEISKVTTDIQTNQTEIATINSSIKELEKFNGKLETQIEELSNSNVSDADMKKLEALKEEFNKSDTQRKELKEEKAYSEATRAMLQDTGIKTKIIKQYLPVMNQLINKYLKSMEFYVNFTLDENFEETIKSRHRDKFNYASFSEGEKMRIDLALLFTWRAIAKMKNSTNTNLLILDEIFDSSLDGTGTDEFLKILNTLEGENVFVISHKQDQLIDKFKEVIRFEKHKNFSKIA